MTSSSCDVPFPDASIIRFWVCKCTQQYMDKVEQTCTPEHTSFQQIPLIVILPCPFLCHNYFMDSRYLIGCTRTPIVFSQGHRNEFRCIKQGCPRVGISINYFALFLLDSGA